MCTVPSYKLIEVGRVASSAVRVRIPFTGILLCKRTLGRGWSFTLTTNKGLSHASHLQELSFKKMLFKTPTGY